MINMTQPKLYPRGKILWVRFSLNGEVIKRSLNIEDNKANRKLATINIIPQMLLKVHSGEFFNNEKTVVPTVDEFIKKSFDMHKNVRKKKTHDDYLSIYRNHIKTIFGKKKLDQIKPSHIKLWQNSLLEKGLSPARIKNIRCVLTLMFRDALEDEIITKSPLEHVKVPRILPTQIKPFSLNEVQEILSNSDGWLKNFLATAFFTGARSGELIGLKWEDVDFVNKEITIKRSIMNGVISVPKTINSIRTIDIIDSLYPFLESQFKLTGQKNTFVFLNRYDEVFYDIKRIRDTFWKRLLKKVNLDYRPIYHCRHTFATLMIENNEDILWVSNMLGHINSSMTLSRYAKYVKRSEKQRAKFLNGKFE